MIQGKIVGIIWNIHFWPFQIYTSHFWKNCQKKFGMAIFGHSEFISIFWGENCWKKFGTVIFGHSKFIPAFLGKNHWKKFGMAIFGHSKFIPVFFAEIVRKNLHQPF